MSVRLLIIKYIANCMPIFFWFGALSAQELPKDIIINVKSLGGDFNPDGGCLHLYCAMPMRFFPIVDEGNGDHYGLYYPRDGSGPWVVLFGHEETRYWVITTSITNYKKNKAKYHNNTIATPEGEDFPNRITLEIMNKGRYPTADIASVALCFLADNLDWGIYDHKLEEFIKSGKEVRNWFHSSSDENKSYNKAILGPEQLMQWRPWMSLGKIYAQQGKISHAMNCVDMAIQMSHRYPNYGETEKSKPSWKRLVEILDAAKSIVEKSDEIDKYTYEAIYKSAISFAKE